MAHGCALPVRRDDVDVPQALQRPSEHMKAGRAHAIVIRHQDCHSPQSMEPLGPTVPSLTIVKQVNGAPQAGREDLEFFIEHPTRDTSLPYLLSPETLRPFSSPGRAQHPRRRSGAPRLYSRGTLSWFRRNPPKPTLLRQGYGGLPAAHSSTGLHPWLSAKAGKINELDKPSGP